MTDPVGFLANAGTEWEIACVTVDKALRLQSEQRGDEWAQVTKRIGAEVGSAVTHAISRMFSGG